MSLVDRVKVEKEFGLRGWTVRIDGRFVVDFYRESTARRTAMNLIALLSRQELNKEDR